MPGLEEGGVVKRDEHEALTTAQKEHMEKGEAMKATLEGHVTEEQYREFQYPEYPPEFADPEYCKEIFEKERNDPKFNPNLNLTTEDQEFWDNAARKPWHRAMLRSEQHWIKRKNVWLRQYEHVETMNKAREDVAEALEDCSMEVKRLVTPIMQYKIVETLLWNVTRESKEYNLPFKELVQRDEVLSELKNMRNNIDRGGPKAAQEMIEEYNARATELMVENHHKAEAEKKAAGRITMDMDSLVKCLNWGQKCKKDGMIEWAKGEWEEAHAAWKEGDKYLKKFKAPDHNRKENKMILDLHNAILKNISQAAIKCGFFTDALEAAEDALRIDEHDHKSWFRKACALEGLGRYDDVDTCLDKIDEAAVGRHDRDRICKETQAKRDKMQSIRDRESAESGRMLQRGLQKGIFSEDRDKALPEAPPAPASAKIQDAGQAVQGTREKISQKTRKRITRDGAYDLLMALESAYGDSTFQAQIKKLAMDVEYDKASFVVHLRKVALHAQKPVLERWGFDPTAKGVLEMQAAIQDYTKGSVADEDIKTIADRVVRTLYAGMYEQMALQATPPPAAAATAPARSGAFSAMAGGAAPC